MERWRRSFPARQLRARPLACFSAAFLIGLIIARQWTPPLGLCAGVCGLAALAAVGLRFARRRTAAMLMLVGLLLGMARMSAAVAAFPAVDTRYSVAMEGRVVSEPFVNKNGRVVSRFRLESADGEASALCLRLYLRGDEALLSTIDYGQRLRLKGHIWANDPVTNPYEFDFGGYLRRNGMSAIATAKIEDVEIVEAVHDIRSAVIGARRAIGSLIDRLFPRGAALVRALVLGDRSQLSDEMRDSLHATGTAHLIAISGLHVTVLAMVVSLLLGQFMSKRLANALTLAPLFAYGALIGFSAPFVRALTMFAIFSFAPIAGLPSDPVTRLGAAMLVWLAIRPLDIADAGFVLSYSASAGMILLMPPIEALLRLGGLRSRIPRLIGAKKCLWQAVDYAVSLLCASISAQLATLPAVIAFFGTQSVVSLPFNLVCVPLCMLGYVLSIPALLLGAIWLTLGSVAACPTEALFGALAAIARASAQLPVTSVRLGRYPAALILLHAGLMLACSNMSRVRPTIRRFLPLSLVSIAALATLIVFFADWPFSLTFLDAEQADCAVVRTRGHTYVIDVGDTYTPVADYLSATSLRVDAVFLSHPHQDHAGGLSQLLAAFKPGAVYVPEGWYAREDVSDAVREGIELARSMGIDVVELSTGDVVPLSRAASAEVFSPFKGDRPKETNDMSMLLRVACDGRSALFTGDLTIEGEPEVIPECDILKVAHHGSDNATSARFLEAATPEIAVISVGENNFGHPGEAALERIESACEQVLRTDRCGAITLTPAGDGWRIQTYLEAPDEVE